MGRPGASPWRGRRRSAAWTSAALAGSLGVLALIGPTAAAAEPPISVPPREARALDGSWRRLPGDLAPGRTALVISFRREDLAATVAWRGALDAFPSVQVPVFPSSIRLLRPLIEGGLRDRHPVTTHGRIWPVWGDPKGFRAALGLGDDEGIAVVITEPDGSVRGIVRGEPSPEAVEAVRGLLSAL